MGSGELSAVELMQSVIARTREVDGRVRAFNSFDEEDALAQARASDLFRSKSREGWGPAPSRGSR